MTVAVVVNEAAQKEISKLPAAVQARVSKKFEKLAAYPNVSGVKALKGKLAGQYRVRVGNYRILFTIETGKITVVSVDDRKESY